MSSDIDNLKAARRRRVAEEISDALKASGMTRKEFAAAMHRQPSEVTKWLSGTHNFTCDLLEEISTVLCTSISGADTRLDCSLDIGTLTDGYGDSAHGAANLYEPSGCSLYVELPASVVDKLRAKAAGSALTFRQYVSKVLCDDAVSSPVSAMDFCGVWPDEMPSAEDLRSMRTQNVFPDIF